MELATEQPQSLFPHARVRLEGTFLTPQGNNVHTVYADLSGNVEAKSLCLVKGTEAQYELATASTIRLSRPAVFRHTGEVLIQDEQEGRARTSTSKTVDVPGEDQELADERVSALNAALQLGRTKMSVSGNERHTRSNNSAAAVSFGHDFLIYCTSMRPPKEEEEAWRRSLAGYTRFTPIYRPTQFAQALGLGVCAHIGVRGKAGPVRAIFDGFRTLEERRTTQMVLHGPMMYVDNPYQCIDEAKPGWERLFAMIFLRSREHDYAAQKEYRFAMLSIGPEVGDVFDLPVSGILKDCLSPVEYPEGKPEETVAVVSTDESPGSQVRPTGTTYTYRRRTTRRELSGWNREGPGSERSKEEVVEETVTSPEEVPEPFPSSEERWPDVIVFQQVGTRFQFIHEAYRDEETQHWRVETLRRNPALADGPSIGARPVGLVVPPDLRYETLDEHPADPRLVLEFCLNPSVPKPPIPYAGLSRCSPLETAHVLACGESLWMAVDLLDGVERARAAASAWYAQRFVLDLVTRFGPIVHTVCIIRDSLAVVELTPARLTGAIAWAALSGAGTYLLYIDDGQVEEKVFPGGVSRAGHIGPGTYLKLLESYGWTRIREV